MRNSYPQKSQNKGFTIVELIVIVVVIGILAAITIVSYNAITENSRKEQVATSARTLNAALGKFKSERGSYPDDTQVGAVIQSAGLKESDVQYSYNSTSGSFCFTVSANGMSANITSGNSLVKEGGCAGHGVGGQSAVANLISNPRPNSSYWFPSSASVGSVTFVGSGLSSAARSTRITTAAYALYSNRTSSPAVAQQGDTYTIIFTISSSIATTVSHQVGYGTGTSVIGSLSSSITLAAGVPQTISRTVTIPSGYDGQPIFNKFLWSAGAAGDYFDVSKVMWVKGTYSGAYADGESTNWIWDGTPNASSSRGPAQ